MYYVTYYIIFIEFIFCIFFSGLQKNVDMEKMCVAFLLCAPGMIPLAWSGLDVAHRIITRNESAKKSNIDNVSSNKTNIAACKENGDDGIFSKIKNMFVLFLSPFAAKFLIIFFVVVFSVVLCTWWFNLNLILLMEKCAVGLIHIITTVQKLFMIHISWDRLQGKRYTSTSNGILFRAAIFDFFCQSNGIGKNSKRKNPRKSSWVSK